MTHRHSSPPRRPTGSPGARGVLAAGLGFCALVAAGAGVAARAPEPVRPVSADIYSGRWYEIARTPNKLQKDCQGPTSDFQGWADGAFVVTETCHRGGPAGPEKVVRARARVVSPSDNARFRMSFFGGLVHQEYWVLDHADDNAWLIMATPGGNFVWVMARRPTLSKAALAAATARVAALGYPLSRLIYPGQGGG